ncbi:Signal transduction histidine-protein kinase BarA [Aquicella siphonis]|uniref:Signal transduction histidine-protein kinase BarA n=1 Tax=Aquicella siphonis TaxID=254247 RepID=A0A5E4PGV9_9COXI|nr:Hpt domain-containing protein [Aquicella siphonis]VVC75712.1 Signal transduction histidine-protein kinase BarA [Aquicella siphonis]
MDLGNLPVIDWEQGIRLAGNKRDLAEEMLALLMKGLPQDITAINNAFHAQNYSELLRLVHKLHGALCYCGLPRLKTIAGCLETQLKNNIMDSLPSLIKQLDSEVALLLGRNSLPKT